MAIFEEVDGERTAESHHQRSLASGRAYKVSKDIPDLEAAIHHAQIALDLAETSSTDYLDYIYFLAYYLGLRHGRTSQIKDLELSIKHWRLWLQSAPKDHYERPLVLSVLSDALDARFRKNTCRADIDEAVELATEACSLSSLRPSQKLVYLRTLGLRLKLRWRSLEIVGDLDKAVEAWENVVSESSKTMDADRVEDLADLNQIRYARYKHFGDVADLRETLRVAREVCEMVPEDFHTRSHAFSHLCEVIYTSTEAGILPQSSLEEAVTVAERGLSMCRDDSQRVTLLNNLMNRNRDLFKYHNNISELQKAIAYGRKAVALTPIDDPQRPMWQQNLALCLQLMFEHTGDWQVFGEVFDILKAALITCQSDADRAMVCNSLAAAYQERFRILRVSADIQESVRLSRKAVENTPRSNELYAAYVNNLGSKLVSYYRRSRDPGVLEESIACSRESLSLASNDMDKAMRLRNLASKLLTRYESSHQDEDWIETVSFLKQAITMTPDTRYLEQAENYFKLSDCMHTKFTMDKSRAEVHYLRESIKLAQTAINLLPPDHFSKLHYSWIISERQLQLMLLLTTDEEVYEIMDEITEAGLVCYQNQATPILWRIAAGRAVSIVRMCRSEWAEAAKMGTDLVQLTTRSKLSDFSREDFQTVVGDFSQISAHAAMSLLNAGESPERALSVKDLGCGLMSGLSVSNSDLDGQSVVLQDKKFSPSSRVQSSITDSLAGISLGNGDSVGGMQVSEEFEEKMSRLLDKPSFTQLENFQTLADRGPLVSFNVTGFRCDAFVVTRNRTDVIPLPLLKENDLIKHTQTIVGVDRLTNCKLHQRAKNNNKLREILLWLWQVAVKPVLDFLGFQGESDVKNLPRLWWVLSGGRMSIMPLHAAGSKWDRSFENTAGRVVSSYVPTMKALAYSRERAQSVAVLHGKDARLLAVQMAHTPGDHWADLNTAEEMRSIIATAQQAGIEVNLLQQPSIKQTTDLMQSASIVHFACHAEPDWKDPSQTALLLQKDENTLDKLTISQLFDQEHSNAQLAYLSACSTAQQYDRHLLDEGIHLGNAFLLMGFPSVVATQWEADDSAASIVAAKFYNKLLREAGSQIDSERVARSLHEAVTEYRKQKLGRRSFCSDDIIAWAPYVHIGA